MEYKKFAHVALHTTAAPSYFPGVNDDGYVMIDGGLWANPVMNALVDALACYDVPRENVRILTIGTGDTAFTITRMRGWEAFGIGRFCALSPQRHARSPSTRWAKPFCLSERTMSFGSTRLKVRRQSGWTT